MEIIGVVANPRPNSFTHAALSAALDGLGCGGATHAVVDLYAEAFNPVLSDEEIRSRFSFDSQVQRYQSMIQRCSGIVISYPDWWGMPPAMLKGWLDRILRPGVAFDYEGDDFEEKHLTPLLHHCPGMVIAVGDMITESAMSTTRAIWGEIFAASGIRPFRFEFFGKLRTATKNDRSAWLDRVRQTARELFCV